MSGGTTATVAVARPVSATPSNESATPPIHSAAAKLQVPGGGVKMQRQSSAPRDPKLPNMPNLVEYKNMRFLIFDAPSDRNIDLYIKEMEKHGVTDVVRVCEPTYDKQILENKGIHVHDWPFTDGDPPPSNIVGEWLHLVESRFGSFSKDGKGAVKDAGNKAIGVHCVAGLGRAPILVAMALIEGGMQPLDSVIHVRNARRGAINAKQLKFVENYKRRAKDKACIIQ
ncbi:Protein tyrosine phosphatase type IVA 1 [Rhizophlyctis rosea]|uniref:protein-tyrosine-phosphatase n=1 Tax=Rhizophlyctis rosea TaxID=64517 RepID=A0AAD5SN16_9FUNG|nr:Protein tyrosine phosphatase type IVA 1 [Rhizophlyctis rosea]